MLIVLLHAILMWQQAQMTGTASAKSITLIQHEANPPDQFSKPYVFSLVQEGHVESGKIPCLPLYECSPVTIHEKVIDVAPLEWAGPDTRWDYSGCPPPEYAVVCVPTKTIPVKHRTCGDASRFLVQSEDRKWHCLALNR